MGVGPLTAGLRRYLCPACGGRRGVTITFGYPGPDLIEAVLGGCSLPLIGEPERQRLACGHRWPMMRRSRAHDRS